MKKIPGIDRHVLVKDNYDGIIKLRRLCMVRKGTAIHHCNIGTLGLNFFFTKFGHLGARF